MAAEHLLHFRKDTAGKVTYRREDRSGKATSSTYGKDVAYKVGDQNTIGWKCHTVDANGNDSGKSCTIYFQSRCPLYPAPNPCQITVDTGNGNDANLPANWNTFSLGTVDSPTDFIYTVTLDSQAFDPDIQVDPGTVSVLGGRGTFWLAGILLLAALCGVPVWIAWRRRALNLGQK
jgi:hypothetical protein